MLVAFVLLHASAAGQSPVERDTDFKISLARVAEPPGGVQAQLVTTNTYPCAGYSIRSQVTWDRDTVSIRILGFVRPSPCVSTADEATGTASLGILGDTATVLRITYRGFADLHRLIFQKHRVFARPIQASFTRVNGY